MSCTSSNNGGAVLWTYMKPDGLETWTFSGNKAAVYGNDIAAVPQKLMVVPGTSYTNKVITNQRSGGAFPKLTIGIYDTYGQIVSSLNDATLTITVTGNTGDTYPSFISQPSSIVSSSGVFTFDNVVTTGTPGITQTVFFKSTVINENIPTNAAYLSSNHLSNSGITFTVGLRKWIAGESFLSDGQWSPWEAGIGYLMTAPTTITSWTPCPISYAYCLGGNTLGPKAGFWRPNLNTT